MVQPPSSGVLAALLKRGRKSDKKQKGASTLPSSLPDDPQYEPLPTLPEDSKMRESISLPQSPLIMYAKGGKVSASKRADGIAQRGKTRGKYL